MDIRRILSSFVGVCVRLNDDMINYAIGKAQSYSVIT